jgi:hypothetical protein
MTVRDRPPPLEKAILFAFEEVAFCDVQEI